MGSIQVEKLQLPNLSDSDVCPDLGFVPSDFALINKLGTYYEPWNDLISQLSVLLDSRQVRKAVKALPLLRIHKLASEAQRRHTYLILAGLVQAYVYEDPDCFDGLIPPALSEPFLEICDYWDVPPILTFVGFSLWNWSIKTEMLARTDSAVMTISLVRELFLQDLNNVEMRVSFTGTIDEKAFALVPALVEAEGGCMVPLLLNALEEANSGNVESLIGTLKTCIARLTAMSKHLQVIHELCDPQIFYHQIRPFLIGSRGLENKGLPDGFTFELADGQRIPSKFLGTSAASSSLFPFLDHMFGIERKSAFLQEMRLYMPKKHRHFLEAVERLPSLRQFVDLHPDNTTLSTRFEECVKHLRDWRTKHIGLVTRYVMMPALKQAGSEGVKGTAGSLPVPFLKRLRDETV